MIHYFKQKLITMNGFIVKSFTDCRVDKKLFKNIRNCNI